jgi:hypothetical protein
MRELLMRVATAMSLSSGKDELPHRAAPPMSKSGPSEFFEPLENKGGGWAYAADEYAKRNGP